MIALDNGDRIRGDAAAASEVDYLIFGFVGTVATQIANGQLPAAIGDLYTAGADGIGISSIILVNTGAVARAVNLYLTPSGGTARRLIPKDYSLGSGEAIYTDGTVLKPEPLTLTAHASTHAGGGSDPVDVADLVDSEGQLLTGAQKTDLTDEGETTLHTHPKDAGTIVLTARGGTPSTSVGCAAAVQKEYTTNDVDIFVLAFDKATQEHAQWAEIVMPPDWDGGTITAKFHWTTDTAANDVIWGLQGRSYGNDEALDQAWGVAQEVTDTVLAAGDLMVSGATAAITLAGTPVAGEMVAFRAYRKAADAGDTHDADALLISIEITYTRT